MTRNAWAAGLLAMGLLGPAAALAQPAPNSFAGATINIVVGYTTGGGHDSYARLLSRHIARHIPGNPNVIVQNMPGAASAKAVQYLDTTAPKDGTVMATFNPDIITQSLLDPDQMKIDFSRLAWIGSMTRDFRACYAWHGAKVADWAALRAHPKFNVGSGAVGSSSYINGAILIHVFGIKINQVLGYPGSSEIRLALERGELDGACGSWSSVPQAWIADAKIKPLVRFSAVDLPGAANVPYIIDLAQDAQAKRTLGLLLTTGEIARPYATSLAVPAARVAVLRNAFDATIKDGQLLAEADKLKLPIYPVSGPDADALVKAVYGSPPEVVAAARAAIK